MLRGAATGTCSGHQASALDRLAGRSLGSGTAHPHSFSSTAQRFSSHAAASRHLRSLAPPSCSRHQSPPSNLHGSQHSGQHMQPQPTSPFTRIARCQRGASTCTVAAAMAGGAAGWTDEKPLAAWRRLPLLRNTELLQRCAWTVALASLVRVGFFIPLPDIARSAASVPAGVNLRFWRRLVLFPRHFGR